MFKPVLTIVQLLKLKDKGVSEADNTLSRLLRSMFDARGITPREFEHLVNQWVDKKYAGNDKHRSSAKSNVNRAVAAPEISWKTFNRAMHILKLKRVTITIQAEWPDGKVTYHQDTLGSKITGIEDSE